MSAVVAGVNSENNEQAVFVQYRCLKLIVFHLIRSPKQFGKQRSRLQRSTDRLCLRAAKRPMN